MNVKGFGAWPSRNDFQGGQRPLGDPFNKALKGDPFNEAYKKAYPPGAEYASFGMDEYHHYPAQKDLTADQEDQSAEKKRKDQQAKKAKSRRMRMMQQVVCLAAGSVVLVSAYQASINSYAHPQPDDPSQEIVEPVDPDARGIPIGPNSLAIWQWNEDNSGATFVVTDNDGNVTDEIPAAVSTTDVPAGCTTEAKTTYTASVQWNGSTFTDSRDEVLSPALGHSFDSGTEVTLDDGQPAMDFACTRCGEHFVIITSIVED